MPRPLSLQIVPHVSRLRRLEFDIKSQADVHALATILNETHELERLQLHHDAIVDYGPIALTIPALPALRNLELYFEFSLFRPPLASFLSIIPTPGIIPHVERIHLTFDEAGQVSVPPRLSGDSPELSILMDASYACLADVKFELYFPSKEGYILDNGQSALGAYIEEFWGSGTGKVPVSVSNFPGE